MNELKATSIISGTREQKHNKFFLNFVNSTLRIPVDIQVQEVHHRAPDDVGIRIASKNLSIE